MGSVHRFVYVPFPFTVLELVLLFPGKRPPCRLTPPTEHPATRDPRREKQNVFKPFFKTRTPYIYCSFRDTDRNLTGSDSPQEYISSLQMGALDEEEAPDELSSIRRSAA